MPSRKGEPFRWDALVRLTHWGVAAVCIGNLWVNEAGEQWHEWLGYGAIALITLRLLWESDVCQAAMPVWVPSFPVAMIFASRRARCVSGNLRHRVITAAASWLCGRSGWWCWSPLAAAGFKIPRWVLNWGLTSGMSGVYWCCRG